VRGRLLLSVSLLAGILIPAGSASGAGPGVGIRLVAGDARDTSASPSYIVDRLAPGTRIRRRVEISNSTGSVARVAVYAAAAGVRRGKFTFAAGHSRNELSSWTSASQGVLRLAPGTKAFDTLTIAVPKKASPGERFAVVWAEVSERAPATGGITLVNRVGVRMYLSIGPGGAPPANFALSLLAAKRSASGRPFVLATVHNSGRRTIDPSGTLTLTHGPGGLRAGPFPIELRSGLTPGSSAPAIVRLDKQLPRGPWRARMRLTSGTIQRTAAATITFPRRTAAARATRPDHRILGAVILLALLTLTAIARPFFRLVRPRHRVA
jgi:hypothetical protein